MVGGRGEPQRARGAGRDADGSAGVPVARIEIEGRPYGIVPATEARSRPVRARVGDGSALGARSVGELSVGAGRYLIVPLELCAPTHQAEPRSSKPLDVLTRRELQVVMLVAEGRVNKQIADHLKISEWTVSTHLRRIFAKLGVDSRAAMVYRCTHLIQATKDREAAGERR